MTAADLWVAAAAVVLALLHAFGGRLRSVHIVPRSWVLSAGSGVSVAYVVVHLLPELAEIDEHLAGRLTGGVWGYIEAHAWLVTLAGLAAFYGLELRARRATGSASSGMRRLGWLHLGSYAMYNAIVGYLLHDRVEDGAFVLLLFTIAMGVHFLVNDHGLREQLGQQYRSRGRWVVASGVVAGAVLGAFVELAEAMLGVLVAFLAGGIVMNVMKEELPENRRSRWTPFVLGAAAYAALLLSA
ncbi:MAG: hypothetical protein R3320_13700 [Nitriliruptorales bacterium]|nr:hypothetical protein [Nitriliruptorales bacterium]